MMFTNSPYEPLMKEKNYFQFAPEPLPPKRSKCHGCSYWQGRPCFGTCYKRLLHGTETATLGQVVPKSQDTP
jgi:hypothetical protein